MEYGNGSRVSGEEAQICSMQRMRFLVTTTFLGHLHIYIAVYPWSVPHILLSDAVFEIMIGLYHEIYSTCH